MERELNVNDFAALVGTTPKTIYARIANYEDLPVNEWLKTVKKKVKGREITFVATDDEQISLYQKIYGKKPVNIGEYYETVTESNRLERDINKEGSIKNTYSNGFDGDFFDKLLTLNNEYNDRLERVNDELITAKSQLLLLEDKRNVAEGDKNHWQNEFFKLKEENKALSKELGARNKALLIVTSASITLLITFIIGVITYNILTSEKPIDKEVNPVNIVSESEIIETEPQPVVIQKPVPAKRKK